MPAIMSLHAPLKRSRADMEQSSGPKPDASGSDSDAASGSDSAKPLKRQRSNSDQVFRCEECDRPFNRRYTLNEHVKTHTGERPYRCLVPACTKRFTTTGNLARHQRLHGFIQPLECPIPSCSVTVTSQHKLEKHVKGHYSNPIRVCHIPGCGKTFSTTGNLNRHLRNQHYRFDEMYGTDSRHRLVAAQSSSTPPMHKKPMQQELSMVFHPPFHPLTHQPIVQQHYNDHHVHSEMLDILTCLFDDQQEYEAVREKQCSPKMLDELSAAACVKSINC